MRSEYFIGQTFAFEPPAPAQVGEQDPAWFAFQTPPLKEVAAEAWLGKRGIESWFPTEPRRRRLARGKRPFVEYEGKVVPRYIFARFTGQPQWHVLRGCRWLSRVVGVNGYALPVTDEVMAQMAQVPQRLEVMRQREIIAARWREMAAADRRRKEAELKMIRPGDKVRITAGVMEGWVVDVCSIHAGIAKMILPSPILGVSETQADVAILQKLSTA